MTDIKQARQTLSLSQSQMADAMNVPVKTLQRWELTGKITNQAAKKLIHVMLWFYSRGEFENYLGI